MTDGVQPRMRGRTDGLRGRPSAAAHASRTAVFQRRVRLVLLSLGAAGLLALSGAFGSGAMPPFMRLGYWLMMMACGGVVGTVVSELFVRRGWMDGPLWRVAAVTTLAVAVPLDLVVWCADAAFFRHVPRLSELSRFAPSVFAISAAMTALNLLLGRAPAVTHAPDDAEAEGAPTPPARARFLDRLPPKLRGAELYAVESEDHYLRLHTDRGSDLILLRLADAVAELDGLEGAQTHRSWWVAKGAVAEARRGDGRAVLVLRNGAEAPVSRTYAPELRRQGWF